MSNNSDYLKLGNSLLKEITTLSREELFQKIAYFYSDNEAHGKRLEYYFNQKFFCASTPVVSNVPENGKPFKGNPISCFLNEVDEHNVDKTLVETIQLSKYGGGLGTLWDNFPSIYDRGDNERNSFGIIPFNQLQGKLMRLTAGFARKVGSLAVYLNVRHADILNFIKMRKNSQGMDPEFIIPRYVHHAVVISDEFMNCVVQNKDWFLYNKNGSIVNKIKARDLWMEIMTTRTETGEPYILFEDNANKQIAPHHKKLGLKIKMSNLCTEIVLPTGKDHNGINRTAICCLSSLNLAKYDEWKDNMEFFEDVARFMDNLLTYFIVEGSSKQVGDIVHYEETFGLTQKLRPREKEAVERAFEYNKPIANSIYSAYRSRDIGIGAAGWHTLLQMKNIAFESEEASRLNREVFQLIRKNFDQISIKLSHERGACPDAAEFGIQERFSYKLAIAPTSQIAAMMGVSRCIEVEDPVFVSKNQVGFHMIKNPLLQEYLETKGLNDHQTWMKIASEGLDSVVNKEVYEVFKGPYDVNPLTMVKQVAERPIDQAQSFTIFVPSPININDLVRCHLDAWKAGVKTFYYCRTTEHIKTFESVVLSLKEDKKKEEECLMCQ